MADNVQCSMCNKEVEMALCTRVGKDDPLSGTKEQWRCKVCNALKSRLQRMCAHDAGIAKDYAALEPADRKALIQNGGMQIHVQYYNNTKLQPCKTENIRKPCFYLKWARRNDKRYPEIWT